MRITLKDFTNLTELAEFLRAELSESKEIALYCFIATDETYWKDILGENGGNDNDSIKSMQNYLGSKQYSDSGFLNFLKFVTEYPFLEYRGKKEFYEIEIYTKKIVYFVNPALKRVLIGKKYIFNTILIGDVSKKFWKYEFLNDTWKIEKLPLGLLERK